MHKVPAQLIDPAGNLVDSYFLPDDKGRPVVSLKAGWRIATDADVKKAADKAAAADKLDKK